MLVLLLAMADLSYGSKCRGIWVRFRGTPRVQSRGDPRVQFRGKPPGGSGPGESPRVWSRGDPWGRGRPQTDLEKQQHLMVQKYRKVAVFGLRSREPLDPLQRGAPLDALCWVKGGHPSPAGRGMNPGSSPECVLCQVLFRPTAFACQATSRNVVQKHHQ